MYKTIKTDFEHLDLALNDLEQQGKEIYQILPSVEYDGTLYVIIYKELQNG
jgi:hypothetical protein